MFYIINHDINNVPTISDLNNQLIMEDEKIGTIPLIVGYLETPLGDLTLTGGSSNFSLVP